MVAGYVVFLNATTNQFSPNEVDPNEVGPNEVDPSEVDLSNADPNEVDANQADTRVVLTIAGSDSGGGAGIQADLKTFAAFRTFGTSVITAITAQNTVGVRSVHAVPVDIVRDQIDAVAEDLPPVAVKTGMLATRALVECVAEGIVRHGLPNIVVDPVMVSTSGHRLLDADAERTVRDVLLPLADIVTPNLDEASILAGFDVRDEDAMVRCGDALLARGCKAALIKGGHGVGDTVIDVLVTREGQHRWERPRLKTRNTHGTGCTLSAAIAAGLANGNALVAAVDDALRFVHEAMRTAPGLGSGHGPLNHFARHGGPP